MANIYRMENLDTNEKFEGTANDLAYRTDVSTTTIRHYAYSGWVYANTWKISLLDEFGNEISHIGERKPQIKTQTKSKKKKKGALTELEIWNQKARDAGESYGQYVAQEEYKDYLKSFMRKRGM